MKIGPHRHTEAKYYTMKKLFWSPKSIKVLGINVHPELDTMIKENFYDLLIKADRILDSWRERPFTIIGKITVINSLINTLFVHKFLALPNPPKEFFARHKEIIMKFLWGDKVAKIRYDRLVQRYERLGLKLTDLAIKNLSLKAAWPVRWSAKLSDMDWFYNRLPIADERIWDCNISVADIKSMTRANQISPVFSIWSAWASYNYKEVIEEPEMILNAIIWGNSLIRRENKPLFSKKLLSSKLDRVLDIYDIERRSFYTYDQIINRYGLVINNMYYLGILAAIPSQWKRSIKNYEFAEPIDIPSTLQELEDKRNPSRTIYWSLLETHFPPTITPKILMQSSLKIEISDESWWALYPNFIAIIKPTKLRSFQFRLLSGSLTTNIKRTKWSGEKISNLCTFCNTCPETVKHVLYECHCIKPLWEKLKKTSQYFLKLDISYDLSMVILNNCGGPQKQIVNTMIIILKQFIYSEKCFQRIPTFEGFFTRLANWYQIEKQIVYTDYNVKKWKTCKKWQNIF